MVTRLSAQPRWLIVTLSLLAAPAVAAAPGDPPTVLVLFSDEGRTPATSLLFTGMQRELRDRPDLTLLSQFLDIASFGRERHATEMAEFYRLRYADRHVDIVVTIGVPATAFVGQHGRRIWPSARIVAVAPSAHQISAAAYAAANDRVEVWHDHYGTIEAALHLVPGIREVVLISGDSSADRRYLETARSALAPLGSRVRLTELNGLSIDAMSDRLGTLGDDTVVLVTSYFADAEGHTFLPLDAVTQLARHSRRPLFGVFDTWVGSGIVGGHAIDYRAVGAQAAEAVKDLLDDRAPRPRAPATHWVFDARALSRWNIAEARLPAGAAVMFREPSLLSRYRWVILGATVLVLGQSLLIGGLLYQRRARRLAAAAALRAESARQRTEAQMRLHLHDLAHVNVLASIGQTAAAVAHELNQPLTAVLSNAQALRRLLAREGRTSPLVDEILADIISEDRRAGDVIERMRRLMKKDVFDWAPVDVNAIVQDVTRVMAPEAANLGVRVETDLAASLPMPFGDRIQLQQVLLNLVQNGIQAAAANERRGGRVRVVTSGVAPGLEVSVSDTGPGIAAEVMPRLFEAFYTTKTTGLGLGLSISRTIVEQHGGSLVPSTAAEGGAEFIVRLPVSASEAA
ncbi:MAG TPA: ATP-binding protein [Vicinamibacterales bacterium]|nr:ATP-binding protein [Vicinamibacterales bacterium]